MPALAPTAATPDRRARSSLLSVDEAMTLDESRKRLRDPDPDVRAYVLGKLVRQAKPDDVFTFVGTATPSSSSGHS